MKRLEKTKKYLKYIFAGATALILFLSGIITAGIEMLIKGLGLLNDEAIKSSWFSVGIISAVACAIIGGLFSLIANRYLLRHVNTLFDGMERLSDGRYDTRLDFGKNKALGLAADNFNKLAEQLENTEILRSDFINNFSHEFKTPIVSIKGLIVLLKSGRVPEEKEREYLSIIEEEIDRLTMMTTNILNLSKIENQSILVDKQRFNLSEQIRTCILLEEKKWSERGLSLSLDFDEHYITAAEDLLKQVWLNLIDNAIKFSVRGSELKIAIEEDELSLSVSVSNTGKEISEEDKIKIWHKFYQVDNHRSKSGNGIGLSIVKSIVELHSGEVFVDSKNGINTFTVTFPKP